MLVFVGEVFTGTPRMDTGSLHAMGRQMHIKTVLRGAKGVGHDAGKCLTHLSGDLLAQARRPASAATNGWTLGSRTWTRVSIRWMKQDGIERTELYWPGMRCHMPPALSVETLMTARTAG